MQANRGVNATIEQILELLCGFKGQTIIASDAWELYNQTIRYFFI